MQQHAALKQQLQAATDIEARCVPTHLAVYVENMKETLKDPEKHEKVQKIYET